jgi:cytochrome c553
MAAAQDGRTLAATCASCHGTDGRSATREITSLAGLPKTFIVEQMKAFKEGKRPATVMQQLARGYSDAQIDAIAAYFAAQAK